MHPDDFGQRERLRAMWVEHRSLPFPQSLDKADVLWDNIDPVLVDAEIAGLISHVDGRSKLRHDQRRTLVSLLDDLSWILDQVPEDAHPYFERLRDLGVLALAVDG